MEETTTLTAWIEMAGELTTAELGNLLYWQEQMIRLLINKQDMLVEQYRRRINPAAGE